MAQFIVKIVLDDATTKMQTPYDIVGALKRVTARIAEHALQNNNIEFFSGCVTDIDESVVGYYEYRMEPIK